MSSVFTQLIDLFKRGSHGEIIQTEIGGNKVAMVPDGFRMEILDDLGDDPKRPQEHISVWRGESFVDYWDRFSTDSSICFADLERLSLHAVIDYHGADLAGHCEHNVRFSPRASIGWKFWKELSGQWMEQRSFQRILEERASDITEPSGGDLLDLVANLDATMKVSAGNVERLSDGRRKISYTKQNQIAGNVTIPSRVVIAVPVFEGGDNYEIELMLRWDVDDESHKAKFMLEVPDVRGREQEAFTAMVEPIAEHITTNRFYWAAK